MDERCPQQSALTPLSPMCYLSAARAGQTPVFTRVFARIAVLVWGSHGTDHRIHRIGHHGPAHGEEPHQGRLPGRRAQPQPRPRRRPRQVGGARRDGALSIMVGGDKATFDAVLPIFQALGKTITLLGPLGFGGFTKLANQIIVAGNLTALAEALTLGKKAGLDRELLLTALAGGLAGSKCLEQKKPNYIAGTYNPGFKIDLHFKDLGLIMESSRALGVPLPTTAVVQELFNAMRVKGRGGLDHSGIITLLEDLAGAS